MDEFDLVDLDEMSHKDVEDKNDDGKKHAYFE
jgi:hypothetical protein